MEVGGEEPHRVPRILDGDGTARWATTCDDRLGSVVRRGILVRHRQQDSEGTQLAKNPNCIVGTQNAAEAVILEGVAEMITDTAIRKKLEPPSLKKYGMSGGDGSEPLFRVAPKRIFGFIEKSFPKTATRWTFD